MSRILLLAEILVIFGNSMLCDAGRTHYYGGSGYPSPVGYNNYYSPYGNTYGYGSNGYGYGLNDYGGYGGYYDGYGGYYDGYDYDDEDYDADNYGYGTYGGYGGYPAGYQKQVLPTKFVNSPGIKEYVAPLPEISKSVTTSSLYQTHPTSYGSIGYAGGYGYAPKYGSVHGNGYYRK